MSAFACYLALGAVAGLLELDGGDEAPLVAVCLGRPAQEEP